MIINSVKELNRETIKYDTGEISNNLLGFIVELIGWSVSENKECLNNFILSYFGEKSLEDVKSYFSGDLYEVKEIEKEA